MSASLSAKARFFSQTWSTMPSRSITSLAALYIWVGLRYHIPYQGETKKSKKQKNISSSDTGDKHLFRGNAEMTKKNELSFKNSTQFPLPDQILSN
jgi:hypothetical protein